MMTVNKPFSQKRDISNQQYLLAQQALSEQRFFEAVALFRTAISLDFNNYKEVYLQLAEAYSRLGLHQTAAQSLTKAGVAAGDIQSIRREVGTGNDELKNVPHHTYVRLKILSEHIRRIYGEDLSSVSLLDIGGGAGYLACFLPDVKYVLVEPTVNHLSALEMPFVSKEFDCVVSCHVLEHIAEEMRTAFLDNLCDLAKTNVMLLNPFQVGDKYLDDFAEKSLRMVWEVTGAPWAREHLECGNPSLDSIREYAKSHNLTLQIHANSSYLFTQLFVYMEYFAHVSNRVADFRRINRAYNEMDYKMMANDLFPNDYICVLKVL